MATSEPGITDLPLPRYFISSFGMAAVALVCAASGLAFGLNRGVFPFGLNGGVYVHDTTPVFFVLAFPVLIFPYLFSRCALLEGGPKTPTQKINAWFVSLLLFSPLIVIALLVIPLVIVPTNQWLKAATPLAIALLTFVYLWIRMLWNLRPKNPNANNERLFKNKVLLPAFAICLVSFSYGWMLSQPTVDAIELLVPVALIVLGSLLIPRHWVLSAVYICTTVVGAFILTQLGYEFARVVLVGTLLTLAMGVAEVCKRTVWVKQRHPIFGAVVEKEDFDFYFTGANWASSVFPFLLCVVPLLIGKLAVLPIFLVLSAQYIHWHFFWPRKLSVWLIVVNVLLGFSLPLVLLIQFYASFPDYVPTMSIERLIAWVSVIAAIFLYVIDRSWPATMGEYFSQLLTFNGRNYRDPKFSFLLFLTIAVVVIALVSFLALPARPGADVLEAKAKATIIYLVWLAIFVSFLRRIPSAKVEELPPPVKREGGPDRGASSLDMAEHTLAIRACDLIKLTRLPVALISGLPASLLLALHTDLSIVAVMLFAVPLVAATMAGFVFNDLFDLDSDRAAARDKPLASRRISERVAATLGLVLSIVGIAVAYWLSRGHSVEIVLFTLAGVIAYSVVAKYAPPVKGVATAILCVAPFIYASEVSGIRFPISYYAILICFIVGRELLLDVRDIEADRLANIRTLADRLTLSTSRNIGWSMMAGSLGLTLILSRGSARALFLAAFASLGVCLYIYKRNENFGIGTSRITLVLSVIAASISA